VPAVLAGRALGATRPQPPATRASRPCGHDPSRKRSALGLRRLLRCNTMPEIWYCEKQMRRCLHIAVAAFAVLLLIRPFDCFASGKFDQKAADCCKKGKCSPSNSDDCCKATVQGGTQLVTAKATDHSSPVLDLALADAPGATPQLFVVSFVADMYPPPGSPPDFRLNLPLLI